MVSPARSWKVAVCWTTILGLASASLASEGRLWKHFAVGQASYQVTQDPFEMEPAQPSVGRSPETEPMEPEPPPEGAVEPAPSQDGMPPDPAYQVPLPVPPGRQVHPPAPLVPPDGEAEQAPTAPSAQPDVWQQGCAEDHCVYAPPASGRGSLFSPFRRWACDPCYSDATACVPNGCRLGGLPLGIRWEGWLAQGLTVNTHSPRDRSNFPVAFNDRSNEYQLNQLYLMAERAVWRDDWSVGGRIDLLYGTDHRYTMARGLEVGRDLTDRWNTEHYGLSMPQLYMEVFAPLGTGMSLKMGRFYTILGHESVPAPENFFYSHSYAMLYGEPFTHTGLLAATDVGPLQLHGGLTRGWDNWENNKDELGFLGGICWTSYEERTSLAFAIHTGREEGVLSPEPNTRTAYSLVFSHNLYGPWSCVLQHNLGVDRGVIDGADAKWYGLNMYLFREITENWKFGYRFEWFRDNNGTRVVDNLRADYYQMSWGLNYSPSDRLRIRPSLRWDWTGARNSHLFADGTRDNQLLLDCDVVIRF